MRKIFFLTATAGLALAGVAVHADSGRSPATLALNAEAGKAGAPGQQFTPVKADSRLYDYCAKGLDHMRKGKPFPSSTSFSAEDCVNVFISAAMPGPGDITPAEPGQPGRGGDGGGFAGMPGGRGGAAGQPGQDGGSLPGAPGGKGGAAGRTAGPDVAVDEDLLDYCTAMLERSRPGSAAKTPEPGEYAPSDCVDYFASLDAPKAGGTGKAARDGAAGLSIGGGEGGAGGKRGAGPGGASGGAGGAGVAGGTGGKGGAGGSGY